MDEPSEPNDWQSAYDVYKAEPTPKNLHGVVKTLKPAIQYALAANKSTDDPGMGVHAQVIAGKAVASYDASSGAALPTWVVSQCQRLARIRRQTQTPIKLPDRIWLDHAALQRASAEFEDKHGREPDVVELSDAARMPIKRVRTVKSTMRRTPSEAAMTSIPGSAALTGSEDNTPLEDAVDYVLSEAGHKERRIFELRTGYGGAEPMASVDIAKKLNVTPVIVTRTAARLNKQIQDMERTLNKL